MYIIKNAMRNISRSLGRNILIGIIAFVIAVSSTVAISIKQSAQTAEAEALKNLTITASIGIDRTKLQSEAGTDRTVFRELLSSVETLSLEDMQKYSASTEVKAFNYSLESSLSGSDSFEAYTETDTVVAATDDTKDINAPVKENLGGFSGIGQQGDFTVIGYNNTGGMSNFISGENKISDGTLFNFTNDNTCVISDTLAAYNDLAVGDTITVTNPNLDTENYILTISGIYTSTSTSDSSIEMKFSTAQDPANQIYTSYSTLSAITTASSTDATVSTNTDGVELTTALRSTISGVYSFANIEDYNDYKDNLTNMGLSDNYTLTSTDVTQYEASLAPINNLSNFANIFLILVLSIGGVILVVLNIFNIRERKYEVGVLTAIGMKKYKVATQFMTELFMVTFVSIIIGTMAGAFISVPTANYLLENQISAAQSTETQQAQNLGQVGSGGGLGIAPVSTESVNYLDNINASIDLSVTAQLMGIGVLLTIVSSLGAMIFIVRFEPLKILSNRN
ncbi:MAG: ABC transporter permease [Firmicutes bacterium]|nr:ABC transporter permease [Bacillota bacterium]